MLLWKNCGNLHVEKNTSPRFPSFTHDVLQPPNLLGVPSGLTPECQGPSCTGETKTGHNTADTSQVPKREEKALPSSWWVNPCYYNCLSLLQGHVSDSSSACCSWNPHILLQKSLYCCLYIMASKMFLRKFFYLSRLLSIQIFKFWWKHCLGLTAVSCFTCKCFYIFIEYHSTISKKKPKSVAPNLNLEKNLARLINSVLMCL